MGSCHAGTLGTRTLAHPDNWAKELRYILAHSRAIFLLYEFSSLGLDAEIDMVASHAELREKTVLIYVPWGKADDTTLVQTSFSIAWTLRLGFGENQKRRNGRDGCPSTCGVLNLDEKTNVDIKEYLTSRPALQVTGARSGSAA